MEGGFRVGGLWDVVLEDEEDGYVVARSFG
jgi:hypothetical protein